MPAAIDVADVDLEFPLYHASGRSLKKMALSAVTGRLGEDTRHRVVVKALRSISLSLRPGDRLGLIGRNGAGKTTLLRALAGIYEPVAGTIRIQGTLNALIDANLGLNLDLTGRENARLRGLYAGLGPAAIDGLEADIAEFAELGAFLDLPVRLYSYGMLVRLAFGLATAFRPQVLLMDEWFYAGDAEFLRRATERLEDMVRGAEILVLASHSPSVMRKWCNRGVWMADGRIIEVGSVNELLDRYLPEESVDLPGV